MGTAPSLFLLNKNYTTWVLWVFTVTDVPAERTVFVRCLTGRHEDVITPPCSTTYQGQILNSCIFLINFGVFVDRLFVLRPCKVLQQEHNDVGLSSHGRHHEAWSIDLPYPDFFVSRLSFLNQIVRAQPCKLSWHSEFHSLHTVWRSRVHLWYIIPHFLSLPEH